MHAIMALLCKQHIHPVLLAQSVTKQSVLLAALLQATCCALDSMCIWQG
jgi:hypothetical protein